MFIVQNVEDVLHHKQLSCVFLTVLFSCDVSDRAWGKGQWILML